MFEPLLDPSINLHRRRMAVSLALSAAGLLTACGSVMQSESTESEPVMKLDDFPLMLSGPACSASVAANQSAKNIGRGINFGNMLDAPSEGAWGLRVEDRFIDLIGAPDFVQSVRLPIRWSNHASVDAQATIDPKFMIRVEDVVRRLLDKGVTVILNMHHYRQLDGDPLDKGEVAVAPSVVDVRFLSMWRQIAQRFAKYDDRLLFEVYNEPHGRLNSRWNDLMSRVLRVIRETNPERVIVVGPVNWNSAGALARLILPPDPNVVLTIHHYEPFAFTHQGAEWVSPPKRIGASCCDVAQQRLMVDVLDVAVREATRLGRPIFVGEFGAYEKAPLLDRVVYLQTMRASMEARDLPWMYWELAAGFGVYDPRAGGFRAELKRALYGR